MIVTRGTCDGLTHEGALQVQWHGVLGNHDYGELWLENQTSIPQPKNCPNTYRDTECSYGPLAQVSIHFLSFSLDLAITGKGHTKLGRHQEMQLHCFVSCKQLWACCTGALQRPPALLGMRCLHCTKWSAGSAAWHPPMLSWRAVSVHWSDAGRTDTGVHLNT